MKVPGGFNGTSELLHNEVLMTPDIFAKRIFLSLQVLIERGNQKRGGGGFCGNMVISEGVIKKSTKAWAEQTCAKLYSGIRLSETYFIYHVYTNVSPNYRIISCVKSVTLGVCCTRKDDDRKRQENKLIKAETWILRARAEENYVKQVDLHHRASGIYT